MLLRCILLLLSIGAICAQKGGDRTASASDSSPARRILGGRKTAESFQDIQQVQQPDRDPEDDIQSPDVQSPEADAAAERPFRPVRPEEAHAAPEPYSFSYNVDDPETGAASSREETQDINGEVVGYYHIQDRDGRTRRVDYTAGKDGFKAKIRSNEEGLSARSPADVKYDISASPSEVVSRIAPNNRPSASGTSLKSIGRPSQPSRFYQRITPSTSSTTRLPPPTEPQPAADNIAQQVYEPQDESQVTQQKYADEEDNPIAASRQHAQHQGVKSPAQTSPQPRPLPLPLPPPPQRPIQVQPVRTAPPLPPPTQRPIQIPIQRPIQRPIQPVPQQYTPIIQQTFREQQPVNLQPVQQADIQPDVDYQQRYEVPTQEIYRTPQSQAELQVIQYQPPLPVLPPPTLPPRRPTSQATLPPLPPPPPRQPAPVKQTQQSVSLPSRPVPLSPVKSQRQPLPPLQQTIQTTYANIPQQSRTELGNFVIAQQHRAPISQQQLLQYFPAISSQPLLPAKSSAESPIVLEGGSPFPINLVTTQGQTGQNVISYVPPQNAQPQYYNPGYQYIVHREQGNYQLPPLVLSPQNVPSQPARSPQVTQQQPNIEQRPDREESQPQQAVDDSPVEQVKEDQLSRRTSQLPPPPLPPQELQPVQQYYEPQEYEPSSADTDTPIQQIYEPQQSLDDSASYAQPQALAQPCRCEQPEQRAESSDPSYGIKSAQSAPVQSAINVNMFLPKAFRMRSFNSQRISRST